MSEATLHIPVTLQKLEKGNPVAENQDNRPRSHYGMIYFPEGTTANTASEYIASRQKHKIGEMGVWLLMMKEGQASDIDVRDGTDDDGFTRIKDSKHQLKDGNQYIALFYNGPDIFLIKP